MTAHQHRGKPDRAFAVLIVSVTLAVVAAVVLVVVSVVT